ncbi:MAG: DUF2442 domain-containing protein [Phenylobacterium sp.]|uniref:DUF2442 domain-containing protein n=1 Tax=Phenylobacterium sp. TaxID=1871053 RepID=UPI00271D717E|nr:DUF2442 domain-containing protein [Phenylobacterium sp.]MDO8901731.1 DUF2442 domain-containing protein [Phenylobacterium sp.]
MAITDAERIAAEARLQEDLKGQPKAVTARYDRRVSRIVVELDNGLELAFPPRLAEGLEAATPAELSEIEISPLGDGLHWPSLDVDLHVPGLLSGVFGSKAWMARTLGAAGGRARSARKASAARENGRKGGRPKKAVIA